MATLQLVRHRFWDNDGSLLAGGKVYIYEPGTTTPKNSYTDSTGLIPNTWPLILDANGEASMWTNSKFKINVFNSSNVQVTGYPVDNIISASDDIYNSFFNIDGTFKSIFINTNAAARTYTFPDATGTVALTNNLGSRDRTINSGFRVSQYNSNASVTVTAAATLAYTVDRFWAACTGANVTGQRVAGAGQDQYYWQFTGAAAVTGIQFGQRYEATNTYDLNNQTATFAVELSNSLLTSVTWTAYYANTTDTFGTLGVPTKTQIATGTFTVTSAMATYSTKISIPAAATTGVEIVLSVGAQTSGTLKIGKWHLAQETAFSGFDFTRDIQSEFAKCQRYYQVLQMEQRFTAAGAGSALTVTRAHFVPMRVMPTWVQLAAGVAVNASSATFNAVSTQETQSTLASAAAGDCYITARTFYSSGTEL